MSIELAKEVVTTMYEEYTIAQQEVLDEYLDGAWGKVFEKIMAIVDGDSHH